MNLSWSLEEEMKERNSVLVRRSSQMSLSRRESGNFSRRNSHCSIIQTHDNVVLVQCRPDADDSMEQDGNRNSIDIVTINYEDITNANEDKNSSDISSTSSSSSFCSSELDQNIRQMEETQRRINLTLENLLQLRQEHQHLNIHNKSEDDVNCNNVKSADLEILSLRQTNLPTLDKGECKTTRKRHSLKECKLTESKIFPQSLCNFNKGESDFLRHSINILNGNTNTHKKDNNLNVLSSNTQNQNDNSCRNSYQFQIESPVKNKIQGLINSFKIPKNRNSAEKEVVLEKNAFRDRKTSRTKETFSVEDFTELIKNLPANNFEDEADNSSLTQQPKPKSIQFHIASEMMTSENDFLSNLKIICEDFSNFLIRSSHHSTQFSINNFNNLPAIYKLSQNLSQEFQYRIKSWDQHRKISDIFLHYRSHFNVYLPYLENFSNMNKHFDECCSNNPHFRNICINFEKLPVCRNLKLKHFLLKPVQRLPQYKLLLKDYLKHLDKSDQDYADTVNALEIVTELLKNANDVIL